MVDFAQKQGTLWPSGPMKDSYFDQIEEMSAWHFELDLALNGALEAEKKPGVAAAFIGDTPFDQYRFLLELRYYPNLFKLNFPYQIGAGISVKREWGDLRAMWIAEFPEFDRFKELSDLWRTGAIIQVVYDIFDSAYFRFAFLGEAGLSVGMPDGVKNHLGLGILIGTKI